MELKECTIEELVSQREQTVKQHIGEVVKPSWYHDRLTEIDRCIQDMNLPDYPKPSYFAKTYPIGSVLQKSEAETVARNIMVILSIEDDEWKTLSWDDYLAGRIATDKKADIDKVKYEKSYFEKVIPYCVSADNARRFCKDWTK